MSQEQYTTKPENSTTLRKKVSVKYRLKIYCSCTFEPVYEAFS